MFCYKKRSPLDMNRCKMEQIISLFTSVIIKKKRREKNKYKLRGRLLSQNAVK